MPRRKSKVPQKRTAESEPTPAKRPSTSTVTKTRRTRRYRPGEKALMEIRKYQKSYDLLLPLAPFARLVREIALKCTNGVPFLWQSNALMALKEASEAFIVSLFQDAYLLSRHAKRITLQKQDMILAKKIRGIED